MAYNKTTYSNGTLPYINADNLNNNENQHVLIDNIIGTSEISNYSSSSTYSEGDYCIYNNILYKANQDIDTAESFTTSHWDKVVLLSNNTTTDNIPIGTGFDYFGATAPENYMFADGSAISRETYSALFAIIGTTYGSGDGTTTFNLPDKRERVSVMYKSESTMGTTGATFGTLGAKGGEDKHQLVVDEMPTTSFRIPHVSNYDSATVSGGGYTETRSSMNAEGAANSITNAGWHVMTTGGNASHNNLQPYLVCNYIIKVK